MPIVNETQTVVERIKKRLVERTVSAEQLAERVGMRYDAMLSALAGKTAFDTPTLKRIAAYLGMEEESLIAFESGRTIWNNILIWPAPSRRAASSRLAGIPSKLVLIIIILYVLIRTGRISAHSELLSFSVCVTNR